RDRLDEVHAVREPRQRVMVRLVAQLFLQLRDLCQRVLETAVLDQDAGVPGEGLEEVEVALSERAHVARALPDDEQSERPALTVQCTDDRVAETARDKQAVENMWVATTAQESSLVGDADFAEREVVSARELVLGGH